MRDGIKRIIYKILLENFSPTNHRTENRQTKQKKKITRQFYSIYHKK